MSPARLGQQRVGGRRGARHELVVAVEAQGAILGQLQQQGAGEPTVEARPRLVTALLVVEGEKQQLLGQKQIAVRGMAGSRSA
jgi:hypothetical protein